MQKVDIAFLIVGVIGLWFLFEIWRMLRVIHKRMVKIEYRKHYEG